MDYVRKLNTTAIEKGIHPFDFIDLSKLGALIGVSLPESEARAILRGMGEMARMMAPDMYDVYAFIRYAVIGELFRAAGNGTAFRDYFDPQQQEKARMLSKLYSPEEIVVFRKGAQDLLVSIDPEVHVVTGSLSNISVRDLAGSFAIFASMPEDYRALFSAGPEKFAMVFSEEERLDALILTATVNLLLLEAAQLEEAGLELARPQDHLSDFALWIFLGNDVESDRHCGTTSVSINVAFYCEKSNSLYAPTMQEMQESGANSEYFKLLTAQLFHELYHAFLNPKAADRSAFIAEVLATGRGELVARINHAALAFLSTAQVTEIKDMNQRFQRVLNTLLLPTGAADFDESKIEGDNAFAKKAIEKQPLTEEGRVQACRTLRYLKDPQWLSERYTLGLLSLSPTLWGELSTEARHRAYAAAWAIGSFGRYGNEKRLLESADIKPLFDAANGDDFESDQLESSLTAIKDLARLAIEESWCVEGQ